MNYDDFLGKVQHRARLASPAEALRATRAGLVSLAERLNDGGAGDLAAQLPSEIDRLLKTERKGQETFSLDEYFDRVAAKEGVEKPDAVHHARAVIAVLQEAVTPGELQHVQDQLPADFAPLFESGSEGDMAT